MEHECDAAERKEFVGEEKPDVVTGSGPILAMQLTSLILSCCVHHQLFRCAVVLLVLWFAESFVLIDHRTGVVRKHYPNWKGYLRQAATGLLTVSLSPAHHHPHRSIILSLICISLIAL